MIVPDEIVRSNRRSISLSILKNGSVVVKAPIKMADKDINNFVESKQSWISSKLTTVNNTIAKYQDIISYQKVLVHGNKYALTLASTNKIEITDNLQILFPKKIAPDKRLKNLISWYKKTAKNVLFNRINYLSGRFNLVPSALKITNTKGRWGSCSSKGSIALNFRVLMLPPQIIDYVLVHELCHLAEMNHSKKFWDLVLTLYPQAKSTRQQLKEFSFLLDLYR